MAVWTSYYKILTPKKKNHDYTYMTDAVNMNRAGGGAVASMAWYSQVMKGAGSRLQRYTQYDGMDMDVDISRCLDIIGEEISNDDTTTNLPFLIEYQNEDDEDISDAVVTTLRAALRQWSRVQDLNNRIFRIARCLVKYGDCFFKKTKDTKRWEYVDPSKVMGIEIDEDNVKIAYHLRGTGGMSQFGATQAQIDIVAEQAIVHFTLSDEMGESAPFGESLLQPVFRTFKQLSALEDSVIIYRLTRAPERRVYYIDVGNMPAQRVKQYLESIKNELRQKRMPNTATQGGEVVDGTFNPNCLDMATRVPLLDGRVLSITELAEEHEAGKKNWAYSCHPETGEVIPGLISWAGKTRLNTEVMKITLDNGQEITCTNDHKFPVQGKGFVEAKDLTDNDSLFPFIRKTEILYGKSDYEQVFDNSIKDWVWTHRLVGDFNREQGLATETLFDEQYSYEKKSTIHHKDFNRFNNDPDNLTFMGSKDHFRYHLEHKQDWWDNLSEERYVEIVSLISEGTKQAMALIPNDVRKDQQIRARQSILDYHATNKEEPSAEYLEWKQKTVDRAMSWSKDPEILVKRSEYGKREGYLHWPRNQHLVISQDMFSRFVDLVKMSDLKKRPTLVAMNTDETFMSYYKVANTPSGISNYKINTDKVSDKIFPKLFDYVNVRGWKELTKVAQNYNHKIVKIEYLEERMDTGCITIDGDEKYHNYHTFAIENAVFVKNSISEDIFLAQTAGGRGTRVETLPGGENLGELTELTYFRSKMYQGLRVPSSYLKGPDAQGAQYSDGKVGIAYIEELRFANFIRRLQNKVECIMDAQFKMYLEAIGINIDPYLFLLRLPEPQNFATYRQAALDADLINAYKSISDEKVLSTRFKLERYLGLTSDEIQMNEIMLKQELGIDDNANIDAIRQIYDPIQLEARKAVKVKSAQIEEPEGEEGGGDMGGGEEGGAPGLDNLGGGEEPDMSSDTGLPDLGGI